MGSFSFWHWLIVLLMGLVVYFVIRTARQPSKLQKSTNLEIDQSLARPWARFFARSIDIFIVAPIIFFIVGVVSAFYFPSLFIWLNSDENTLLASIIVLPLTLAVLAMSMTVFGTTIGKAIFAIKVENLTQDRAFLFHLKREAAVWVKGLALGIPIITLFTYAHQYGRVRIGQPASYDEGRARVEARKISTFRTFVGAGFFVALLVALASLNVIAKQDASQVGQTQIWLNPITGKSAAISRTWNPSEMQAENGRLFHFNSNFLLAEALFGYEPIGLQFIDEAGYAEALESALSGKLTFQRPWRSLTIEGRSAMQAYATLADDRSVDIQITITLDGSHAWRTLIFVRGRKVDDATFGQEFVQAVFGTI